MLCAITIYAIGITIAFLVSITVCVFTCNTCQRISTKSATDFQEVQTSATNNQIDFFSEVETTGTEVTKNGARCPNTGSIPHYSLDST